MTEETTDVTRDEWPRFGRFAITGASGMLGSVLTHRLRGQEHEAVPIVRSRAEADSGGIYWKPSAGEIDAEALEGFDVVVHLAGENIFGRWTEAKKRRILQSRREGTELLAETLAELDDPPRVLVSASGVDYYGAHGDEWVDEDSPSGEGFLSEVCRVWEEGTEPASEAGIRTVNLRTGVVLNSEGGALGMMLTPFKLGLGGRIGSGDQYMSWISLEDYLGGLEHVVFDAELEGPVNLCSPKPVTNTEFTETLGEVLNRPTIFPLPGFAPRLVFGQMADEVILTGQRVEPRRLKETDFEWEYPDLQDALEVELR